MLKLLKKSAAEATHGTTKPGDDFIAPSKMETYLIPLLDRTQHSELLVAMRTLLSDQKDKESGAALQWDESANEEVKEQFLKFKSHLESQDSSDASNHDVEELKPESLLESFSESVTNDV